MFDQVPMAIKLAALIAVLAAGPIIAGSFYFGGSTGGIIAVVTLFLGSMASYILVIRKYTTER